MASGDIAAAAGYTIVPGSAQAKDIDSKINDVLDALATKTGAKDARIPLDKLAAAVKTATDAVAAATASGDQDTSFGKLVRWTDGGFLGVRTPTQSYHPATKAYVDDKVSNINLSSRVAKSGDTMTGNLTMDDAHIIVPDAEPATSGYTVAYINGNGRLSKGASSRRYKHDIRDAQDLGDTFAAPLREFKMNDGDGSFRVGRIAEELEEVGLGRYVVYTDGGNGEMVPDSIDFIGFLMAQVEQLHQRVKELEARDA